MTKRDFLDRLAVELFGWNGDPNCCRRCNAEVDEKEFKDEPSHFEWERLRWCQRCQDGWFENE